MRCILEKIIYKIKNHPFFSPTSVRKKKSERSTSCRLDFEGGKKVKHRRFRIDLICFQPIVVDFMILNSTKKLINCFIFSIINEVRGFIDIIKKNPVGEFEDPITFVNFLILKSAIALLN